MVDEIEFEESVDPQEALESEDLTIRMENLEGKIEEILDILQRKRKKKYPYKYPYPYPKLEEEEPEAGEEAEEGEETEEEVAEELKINFIKFRKQYLKKHPGASMAEVKAAYKKLMEDVVEIEEMEKKKYPYYYPEAGQKKKYPWQKPKKGKPPGLSAIEAAIMKMKEDYEKLAEKVTKFEQTPVRAQVVAEKPIKTGKNILDEMTAADAIIWAEKHGLKYGEGVR